MASDAGDRQEKLNKLLGHQGSLAERTRIARDLDDDSLMIVAPVSPQAQGELDRRRHERLPAASNPYKIISEQLHSLQAAAKDIVIRAGAGPGTSGVSALVQPFNSHLGQVRKLLANDAAALETIRHIEEIRPIQERLDGSYHRTIRQQLLVAIPSLLHAVAPYLPPPPGDRPSIAGMVFEASPDVDPPDSAREDVTQLLMRRVLNADLPRWFEPATTTATPLTCLVLEIDHFEAFNEDYGHDKGDEVLRAVSSAIRAVVRGRGRTYRWGAGDELVILLPNCTTGEAVSVAERVRSEIRAIKLVGVDRPITLSVGIAGIPAKAVSADDLRARADSALGEAKEAGRDRVYVDSQDISEVAAAEQPATDDEIQPIVRWLGSHVPVVRKSGARQLVELIHAKRVFHSDDVRIAISGLLKDAEEEVRLTGLDVLNALMAHEREAVGRRYVRFLEPMAEGDPSMKVRSRVMNTIGLSGHPHYLTRIYAWMSNWDAQPYDQVSPVVALIGLSVSGQLRRKIRDDLLELIERAIEPGLSRYQSALEQIERR